MLDAARGWAVLYAQLPGCRSSSSQSLHAAACIANLPACLPASLPNVACSKEGTANGGNRYLTVLMYLNDVEEGGETCEA